MQDFIELFIQSGQEGIALLGKAVLPVLFPFFVLTNLIINILNTNNKYFVGLLSICSGYPNGTRMAKLLYDNGQISKTQARNFCIWTSTPSPIFTIATVGTIILSNTKIGIMIFISSVLAAFINGIIWKEDEGFKKNSTKIITDKKPFFQLFNEAIFNSISAILNVCGIVLFFYILAKVLYLPVILSGVIEMTTGTFQTLHPLLIQFFLSFGGLCIACQNFIFSDKFEISFWKYISYKLTHSILSMGILSLILFF